MRYFNIRLFFLMIPKPLKQYTLFKKDYPFRSMRRRLSEPEDDILMVVIETSKPLNIIILG